MFIIFVGLTLYITYWASKRTKTAKSFYTAGGEITGFQNGLAISGDFMSAASFLGISGLVYLTGFDFRHWDELHKDINSFLTEIFCQQN